MILPFLVECNYNCLLGEPPLHLGGQSLCAGHLILGLPVRPGPRSGDGEPGLRAIKVSISSLERDMTFMTPL